MKSIPVVPSLVPHVMVQKVTWKLVTENSTRVLKIIQILGYWTMKQWVMKCQHFQKKCQWNSTNLTHLKRKKKKTQKFSIATSFCSLKNIITSLTVPMPNPVSSSWQWSVPDVSGIVLCLLWVSHHQSIQSLQYLELEQTQVILRLLMEDERKELFQQVICTNCRGRNRPWSWIGNMKGMP